MMTAKEIAKAIGYKKLTERLDVGDTAVSNAASSNRFPASWYEIVLEECVALGLDCPKDLFSFKRDAEVGS